MKPAISVSDVTKCYGEVEALKKVSFSVSPGELLGIIGPGGAGKSTLFCILTTLLLVDSGTAMVNGLGVVKNYKQIRQRVGYMPGHFSLYQGLTVEENLGFFATVFHTIIRENYNLVKDIYRQIEPFRKHKAEALSGSMKRKLALSCVLIHKLGILFLDEPTTGVDPVSHKEFWEMLRHFKEQGVTIPVSIPVMDEARQYDRTTFISEGEIQRINMPERILKQSSHILCPPGLERAEVHAENDFAIEVDRLTKCFGHFTAVDHTSFQVNRGEVFGFLGADDAGKTIAMRMLCGLSRPTSGIARVAGFDVAVRPEEVKKNIGYMSQRFSLCEDLEVWENIRPFAGIYGIQDREITEKTDTPLNRLGFSDERDILVRSLPLGQGRKLTSSVSTFHSPRIVFLDEPVEGVDPVTCRQFWELIYQAADRGMTIFITTHYMDEAEYCNRVPIMVDGRIETPDTPRGLEARSHTDAMGGVFQRLARRAVRKAD